MDFSRLFCTVKNNSFSFHCSIETYIEHRPHTPVPVTIMATERLNGYGNVTFINPLTTEDSQNPSTVVYGGLFTNGYVTVKDRNLENVDFHR
ncbi:hypothetical protein AVEN_223438-1 [Araneus ventricosus]|uniref:Uncharacterized protein n=1 Tax=Araneus ventricosus TaxID=182803 RepID=A0A4Y2EPT8_ARAVE|nr:hypothetical protein AVEN_223438-1 [Araneus ventricosus]